MISQSCQLQLDYKVGSITMEFTLNLLPDQRCINFIDEIMNTYLTVYNLPHKRELCFVVHELIINAVEAMEKVKKSETESIQINVSQKNGEIIVTVIDHAGGIEEENWEDVFQFDLEKMTYSDRGRGLFFVKNMVDNIWFQHLSDTKFLVGISKKVTL